MIDDLIDAKVTLLDGQLADTKHDLAALSKDLAGLTDDVRDRVMRRLQWIDARLDKLELLVGEVRELREKVG